MDLSLVFYFVLLLMDFSFQYFQKLRLKQHLFDCDKDLKDHLYDLTQGKFETDAVGNDHLIVDTFIFM